MSELKAYTADDIQELDDERLEASESGKIDCTRVYLKSEADKVIAKLENENERLKKQSSCTFSDDCLRVRQLRADYKEACDRLQTANLIKDEQKAKADKLLSCLKYLVMGDLIKDCPPKKVAKEIVKEYDNGLG